MIHLVEEGRQSGIASLVIQTIHLAGGAVQRDDVPLLDGLPVLRHELLGLVVHVDGVRPFLI